MGNTQLSRNGLLGSAPDRYPEVGMWEVISPLGIDSGRMTGNTEVGRQDAEFSLWGVFRLCTLLGQNPLSTSCCRGSYLLNTLMFIIFLWSRNTGWATSSRTP
jgi:hypothetical protein